MSTMWILGSSTYYFYLAYLDIRFRRISLWILLSGLMGSLIYSLFWQDFIADIFSILPGIVLMLMAYVKPADIGMADGIVVLTAGMMVGGRDIMYIILYSMILSSIVGMGIAKILGKRRVSLPYIPYFSIAYIGVLLC